MINHARTLLLNKKGSSRPGANFFLEEFVEPSFMPTVLPGYLTALHDALFGRDTDDGFINFRLRQYMLVLHNTEFVSYVTGLDPRITYANKPSPEVQRSSTNAVALNAEGEDIAIAFEGAATNRDARVVLRWVLEVPDGSSAKVTFEPTNKFAVYSVTCGGQMSSLIPLYPYMKYSVRIINPTIPVSAKWELSVFQPPTAGLNDVMAALEKMDPAVLSQLFAGSTPYSTFKDLWNKHNLLPYRLSGVLLAWVYRVEALRTNG